MTNQYPEIQQPLAQPQQANQLQPSKTVAAMSEQPVSTTQTIITPPLGQIDTVALVQYGGVTTAIILSISVLILSLAEFTKVLVPVMLQKPEEKNE